jgi:hypothetical protein
MTVFPRLSLSVHGHEELHEDELPRKSLPKDSSLLTPMRKSFHLRVKLLLVLQIPLHLFHSHFCSLPLVLRLPLHLLFIPSSCPSPAASTHRQSLRHLLSHSLVLVFYRLSHHRTTFVLEAVRSPEQVERFHSRQFFSVAGSCVAWLLD